VEGGQIPLRWVHVSEPGPLPLAALGVYVHVADLLHGLDEQGEEGVRRTVEDLLERFAPAP
jgi:hypothetical protein